MRIFIDETDKGSHQPLYEMIGQAAKTADLAGKSVWRGILLYGHEKRIYMTRILVLSTELPVIIEIVDETSKIETFLSIINDMVKIGKAYHTTPNEKAYENTTL